MIKKEEQRQTVPVMESLYIAYKTDVFRFALSMVKDQQQAQDITGDVFCKAFENLRQLRESSKVKPWLLSITRNVTLDFIRKNAAEAVYIVQADQIGGEPWQNYEFLQMIECLDEVDRQIVTLHIVNRLEHSEIAKILSLSYPLTRKRYSRSLQKIRDHLEGE